ncbi:hypothetical protein ZHAS_00021543 [Anopheles sinensis]|uniref:Uncharacterized protein n=1 Tax=Anopheles sinensis TaxID=74873 RepID=A0A084WSP9_ANOSI|nr:hypothetical protein ZHAS_00021543 [Anopheles sinensis]
MVMVTCFGVNYIYRGKALFRNEAVDMEQHTNNHCHQDDIKKNVLPFAVPSLDGVQLIASDAGANQSDKFTDGKHVAICVFKHITFDMEQMKI